MKAVLGNHPTSLIHDGDDEIDDMEETNDVIPVNGEKSQQVQVIYVVTSSSFVAINNEDFKILKDMVDFYLRVISK